MLRQILFHFWVSWTLLICYLWLMLYIIEQIKSAWGGVGATFFLSKNYILIGWLQIGSLWFCWLLSFLHPVFAGMACVIMQNFVLEKAIIQWSNTGPSCRLGGLWACFLSGRDGILHQCCWSAMKTTNQQPAQYSDSGKLQPGSNMPGVLLFLSWVLRNINCRTVTFSFWSNLGK